MKNYKDLTIKEKIGQLIVCGFTHDYYDDHVSTLVEKYNVGNVILFARNFKNANQMKKLCQDLHANIYNKIGAYPFIAIDQEGGMVTRMMKDVTFAPSQMTTSATSVENASYEAGKAIGRDMIMLGLNWDYAPCLEINPNLMNNNHNIRCYTSTPESCGKMAGEFMRGLGEYGVISCAKHFPGSGDSTKDSHLELDVVTATVERMKNFTLVPFKMNINVPSIMTTHVKFQALDDEYPATLSKSVLQGLLRKELGYQGMIISDAVGMKAIADNYGAANGAAMALIAGCDMVLSCHELSEQEEVFKKVYEAYEKGELTEEMIDEKLARIWKYKEQILPFLNKYFFGNDKPYEEDKKQSALMQEIVDKSVTIVKGELPKVGNDTLIFAPVACVASQAEDVFDERDLALELKKRLPNTVLKFENTPEFYELAMKEVKKASDVVVFSYDTGKNKVQIDIINEVIKMFGKKAYIVSLKGPMDMVYFKDVENYTVLYEYTPNSIRTIIKLVEGKLKAEGKLPY